MDERERSEVVRVRERRRDPRVNLDMTVAAFSHGVAKRFKLVDLSCGGAQIDRGKHVAPPPVHTIEIDFGDRLMRMLARTVWSHDSQYAVSFLALDELDRLSIAEGIDRLVLQRRSA